MNLQQTPQEDFSQKHDFNCSQDLSLKNDQLEVDFLKVLLDWGAICASSTFMKSYLAHLSNTSNRNQTPFIYGKPTSDKNE